MDKRQGYHFIISFRKQEVRPETAMEITQKFVERYFGDDFQCLYATHDNTEHVHSHILFNSVSWRTGKKYRYEKWDKTKQGIFKWNHQITHAPVCPGCGSGTVPPPVSG